MRKRRKRSAVEFWVAGEKPSRAELGYKYRTEMRNEKVALAWARRWANEGDRNVRLITVRKRYSVRRIPRAERRGKP